MPLPIQPENLGPEGKWRGKPATPEELDKAMIDTNVADNEQLDNEQKAHLLAYTWGMFDQTLRPVDSDPVGIQF